MRYHRKNGEIIPYPEEEDPSSSPPSSLSSAKDEDEDEDGPLLLLRTLLSHPPNRHDPRKRSLPFQPLSYRDFMLFERHYVDAAQGLTSLFLPWAYRLGSFYQSFASSSFASLLPLPKVFPAFLPPKIWYRQPIFYQSNHLGFYADGASIVVPGGGGGGQQKGEEEEEEGVVWLDFELELGILLGKEIGPNATAEQAWDAVAGFCVLNDFSRRDVQMGEMNSGFGPQGCKGFGSSISSEVVSKKDLLVEHEEEEEEDEKGERNRNIIIKELTGRVKINGVTVRECKVKTGDWQWSVGEAIAHVSKDTRLYAGEFFGSGTFVGGAGVEKNGEDGKKGQVRLRVGDEVRLEIDGVGSVTNRIVGENGGEVEEGG